jgi:hypothetical protein
MQVRSWHGENDPGPKCPGCASSQPEGQGRDGGHVALRLFEFREIAERPTLAEFRERLHKRKPLPVALDTGGLLREERTAR